MIKQEIKSFRMDHRDYTGLTCSLPCSMFSVLKDHSLIPDPMILENARELYPLALEGCVFTSEFSVDPLTLGMRRVTLRLSGVDSCARIEVNGCTVGVTDNVHRTFTFDVKTVLRHGLNKLSLYFTPAVGADGVRSPSVRKPEFSFGGAYPALPDMGVLGCCELVAFDGSIIDGVRLSYEQKDGEILLCSELVTVGFGENSRAVATLRTPGGEVLFSGFSAGKAVIRIPFPEHWYPASFGLPNLYELTVTLYEGAEIEDSCTRLVGFPAFTPTLKSGAPVLAFPEGAAVASGVTLRPDSLVLPGTSSLRMTRLIEYCARMGVGFVRFSSDGVYPTSEVLDLCDRLGVAVWLDLAISDPSFEPDGALVDNLCKEAEQLLSELAHHPSLCVVIGCAKDPATPVSEGFRMLLERHFPTLVSTLAPSVLYVPYLLRGQGACALPSAKTASAICSCTDVNALSSAMEYHSVGEDNIHVIAHSSEDFLYPISYAQLAYVTQLHGAEQLRKSVLKSRVYERGGSALIRDLNEPWPATSPALVEYFGRWRIGCYALKKACAPIVADAVADGTRVEFFGANDSLSDYFGTLTYTIADNKNKPLLKDSVRVHIPPLCSVQLLCRDFAEFLSGRLDCAYVHFVLGDGVSAPSSGSVLFTKRKRFDFLPPEISWDIVGNGTDFTLTLSSAVFVKDLYIDFTDADVFLEDNCFDLVEDTPVRIRITSHSPYAVQTLRRSLTLISAYDVGRQPKPKPDKTASLGEELFGTGRDNL